jgi:hypothetical protein
MKIAGHDPRFASPDIRGLEDDAARAFHLPSSPSSRMARSRG